MQTSPTLIFKRAGDAVEAAYRQFKTQPPRSIEGCPCCLPKCGVDVLLTTPLRELPGEALTSYVYDVFLTVGSQDDFRYLLPRIFEVAMSGSSGFVEPEIILQKVGRFRLKSCSDRDTQVIREVVGAWFELAVDRDLASAAVGWIDDGAERVLCGAALAGLPLSPMLACLQQPFADAIRSDVARRFPKALSRFWDKTSAGFEELAAMISDDHSRPASVVAANRSTRLPSGSASKA